MTELLIPIFFFVVISFSAILHEYSHGWMADRLGDPTARLAGRLTLNPIPHIDPIGTLLLPVAIYLVSNFQFLLAYAKPVPVNPFNLRNVRYGEALVAFAGPASNLLLALVFGSLIRFMPAGMFMTPFPFFVGIVVYANLILAVFNLLPIPPLDGSKIIFSFLPSQFGDVRVYLETYGWFFLILFILFLAQILSRIVTFLFILTTGTSFDSLTLLFLR